MYTSGKQQKQFKKLWRSMLGHLDEFADTGNDEALHQLRVDIKKINAVLYFFTGKKLKKLRKPLQTVFKDAGMIRSADIHLGLLNQYRVNDPGLLYEQQTVFSEGSLAFRTSAGQSKKQLDRSGKKLKKIFKDLGEDEIISKYQQMLGELSHLFRESIAREETLHETRKKIKQLFYTYAILDNKLITRIPVDLEYLHTLQDEIGQWHDIDLTLQFLKEKGYNTARVLDRLSAQKATLQKHIGKLAKGFEKKVMSSKTVPSAKTKKGAA